MSGWVVGSNRMKWIAGVTMATWAVGGGFGVASLGPRDAANIVSTAMVLIAALSCAIVMLWAASRFPAGSVSRWTWLLAGSAIAVDVAGIAFIVTTNLMRGPNVAPSDGTMAATVPGYLPMAAALALAMWGSRVRGTSILARSGAAFAVATALFGALLFALLGPGPDMPFSMTAKDLAGAARLFVDVYLVFLPAAVCVLMALRSSANQTSRTWLWVGIGALIWAMADTIYPLVDVPDAESYSIALWTLGAIVMSMGASLAVDFHRAQTTVADPQADVEG